MCIIIHSLCAPLEWRPLERENATRCCAHEESEINVDDVAVDVEQDVAIVPILDLRPSNRRKKGRVGEKQSERARERESEREEAREKASGVRWA